MSGTGLFGWCIDRFHVKCIAEISGLKCSCECHAAVEVVTDTI
jgi:hypothetical protein